MDPLEYICRKNNVYVGRRLFRLPKKSVCSMGQADCSVSKRQHRARQRRDGSWMMEDEMKDKLQRFMWGRYGIDRFNRFLLAFAFICLILSMLGVGFFYAAATVLMGYAYFRIFSRNTDKRSAENQWYLKWEMKVRGFFLKKRRQLLQRKEYHIYKCPGCGQKIRVPRGKGKIAVSCRKCGAEFIRRS